MAQDETSNEYKNKTKRKQNKNKDKAVTIKQIPSRVQMTSNPMDQPKPSQDTYLSDDIRG